MNIIKATYIMEVLNNTENETLNRMVDAFEDINDPTITAIKVNNLKIVLMRHLNNIGMSYDDFEFFMRNSHGKIERYNSYMTDWIDWLNNQGLYTKN